MITLKFTAEKLHRFMEINSVSDSEIMETPLKYAAIVSALGMYDWSLAAKKMLLRDLFISSVSGGGTKCHSEIVKSAVRGEIGATVCLTEMSHGTNTKAIRTTATYVPEKEKTQQHFSHARGDYWGHGE